MRKEKMILSRVRKAIANHDFSYELADEDFQEKVRIQDHAVAVLEEIGSPSMNDELFVDVVQVVRAEFVFYLAQTELSKADKLELIKRLKKEVK